MKTIFVVRLFLALLFTTVVLSAQDQGASSSAPSNAVITSPTNVAPSTSATPTTTNPASASCPQGMVCPHDEKMVLPADVHPALKSYCSVPVDGPYIAMSFDDGPSPTLTPRLLDMLKQRGIKVTFFVIGQNVEHSPEVVARAAAEGHEIGNHTWDHPALTKLSDARVQEEINKTSEAIFSATGKKPVLLRPPYGAMNPRVHRIVDQDGMKVVLWSVDPNDWKRPGSAVVERRILAGAKPGAIILSHDIHPGTIEAMPATLDALLAKGYKFVTVSELIAMESQHPKAITTTPASSTAPTTKK
ncbi:MAG: polysaccharide deacetylase family protein [Chthoniobacterales bacterium]|nr:polysaccharide deacetylase family protein [Chthoniobacterales bacterium]